MLACALAATDAWSQAWWDSSKDGIPNISIAPSLPDSGDPGGIRKRLSERGIVYGWEYTNDVLSNVRGGLRTGTIDQGKLQGVLTADLDKLMGLSGWSFFINMLQIHNTGQIRPDYVGGINTIAAIEALRATRLDEVWVEKAFAGGQASVRAGQLAADTEFFYSELSTMFLQSDWPTIAAVNLPSGGAAYPLSTPGVRVRFDPTRQISLLFAMLNGNPAGQGGGEPQQRNPYGLNFRVNDPPFFIGEAQFRTNMGKQATGLATTAKFGLWVQTGSIKDQRYANDGTSLANPNGSGVPLRHQGDFGVYAVIDQQLYRPAGGTWDSGVSVYTRMSVSPSDRNMISAYVDGGITVSGLVPGRPNDKFGAAMIYARFSDYVRGLDRDKIYYTGLPGVVRDFEANLELTYAAQIIPGWIVQPVVTRIWHPDGDASRNALVVGVRSQWRY